MSDRTAIGQQIYAYFLNRGLAPHQAAAIAGNMAWEGGGRADLVNPGDNYRNSPNSPHSFGIAQWNDRLPRLIEHARTQGAEVPQGDLRDAGYVRSLGQYLPLDRQLDFAWSEMQGPEARALDAIRSGQNVRSSAAGAIGYHRPAGWTRDNPYAGHGFSDRVSLAEQILRAGNQQPATVSKLPMSPPPIMDSALFGLGASRPAPETSMLPPIFNQAIRGFRDGGAVEAALNLARRMHLHKPRTP